MPVKMDGGADPQRFFRELPLASLPTQGDMLYALSRQSTRILKRTERGVDFQGRPFDPYSERGPYYYYASKSGGRKNGGELKRRKQAGQRLARALGHKGGVTRSGGIRFDSYGAFKRALGRGNVDLQGPRAPHMLQEMVVKSGTAGAQIREPGLTQYPSAAKEGRIGIYGAAGARAEGHNEGSGRLPKRRFLDASERDIQEMMDDIGERTDMRIRRI